MGALGNGAIGAFNLAMQVRRISASILESQAFFVADVLAKCGGLVKSTILVNTYSRQDTLFLAHIDEKPTENMKRGIITDCEEEPDHPCLGIYDHEDGTKTTAREYTPEGEIHAEHFTGLQMSGVNCLPFSSLDHLGKCTYVKIIVISCRWD
jgi:hypothetical protein